MTKKETQIKSKSLCFHNINSYLKPALDESDKILI